MGEFVGTLAGVTVGTEVSDCSVMVANVEDQDDATSPN